MTATPALDFFDLTPDELAHILEEQFQAPKYRATQLFDWIYKKGLRDFSGMSNVGQALCKALNASFVFPEAIIKARQISKDGTRKYLLELDRGASIEAVMIRQPGRMTLCVSSQVGCGMGCTFCRTATMGFKRNLSASEIVRQVLAVIKDSEEFGDSFRNIVFMGMGEPLHNVKNVIKALKILTSHHGLEIPSRKITVSTAGLIPGIKKLAEEKGLANLAISLNATNDEIRSQLMPINKRYPLKDLLNAARAYPLVGRKKITMEYVMLSGVNDREADLKRLPKLLHGIPVKLNLIPYNQNANLGYQTPTVAQMKKWHETLCNAGIDTMIRWSKGQDISAACGQLATLAAKK